MSHWAEIDTNNIVIRVLVGNNNDPNGDEGEQWFNEVLGGTWVKTSYNGNIRKNFAGVGYFYNEALDAFIAPQPFASWILDEESCKWQAPVAKPDNNLNYDWDEEAQEWTDSI